jgi:hypothetical protein
MIYGGVSRDEMEVTIRLYRNSRAIADKIPQR